MKYASVKTILLAAQRNQQYGVIKTHSNTVCFSFVNGDCGEDDIIGCNSDSEVISILNKVCNSYIDCDAIETIEVYKQ